MSTNSEQEDPKLPTLGEVTFAVAELRVEVRDNHIANLDGFDRQGRTLKEIRRAQEKQDHSFGEILATLARIEGGHRKAFESLSDADATQRTDLLAADAKARRAVTIAAVRVPVLMVAGAALWKLFEILYPLLPH